MLHLFSSLFRTRLAPCVRGMSATGHNITPLCKTENTNGLLSAIPGDSIRPFLCVGSPCASEIVPRGKLNQSLVSTSVSTPSRKCTCTPDVEVDSFSIEPFASCVWL